MTQATLDSLVDEEDAVDDETTPVEEEAREDSDEDEPEETPTASETDDATTDDEPETDLWGNEYDAEGNLLDDADDEQETGFRLKGNAPGGPWDCPNCGPDASGVCYRCSECGKDLVSAGTSKGRES